MEVPRSLRGDVSSASLFAMSDAVEEAERRTSGEIVVRIVHSLLPLEKLRDRARREFLRLGCDRTRLRNAVLLFVAMKEHRFEIVADEGIDGRVAPGTWEAVASEISDRIHRHGFERGMCAGIERLGEILALHFPGGESDENELPNAPAVD